MRSSFMQLKLHLNEKRFAFFHAVNQTDTCRSDENTKSEEKVIHSEVSIVFFIEKANRVKIVFVLT